MSIHPNKLYEPDSALSRNFLLIAPNIIVLDRLRADFDGLKSEFKNPDALDPSAFGNRKLPLKPFTPEETREIVFKTMLDAETHHTIKGREELDLPQKLSRLRQWCADAAAAEEGGRQYDFVFVDEAGFKKHAPQTFTALAASFTEYKS